MVSFQKQTFCFFPRFLFFLIYQWFLCYLSLFKPLISLPANSFLSLLDYVQVSSILKKNTRKPARNYFVFFLFSVSPFSWKSSWIQSWFPRNTLRPVLTASNFQPHYGHHFCQDHRWLLSWTQWPFTEPLHNIPSWNRLFAACSHS